MNLRLVRVFIAMVCHFVRLVLNFVLCFYRYGFIREVRLKYKVFAGRVLQLIDQVFRSLPLGTIIDGRVLVVHGGISDTTDLARLTELDRHKVSNV